MRNIKATTTPNTKATRTTTEASPKNTQLGKKKEVIRFSSLIWPITFVCQERGTESVGLARKSGGARVCYRVYGDNILVFGEWCCGVPWCGGGVGCGVSGCGGFLVCWDA